MDACGQVSSNGTTKSIGVMGQSGGYIYAVHSASHLQHYGGFLGMAAYRLTLDTDHDGVINELDSDNDNDNLSDSDEVRGLPWLPATVSSDPNQADTDGDESTDWEESVAGTHPDNADSFLEIISMSQEAASNGVIITWSARDGKNYNVWRLDDLLDPGGAAIMDSVSVSNPTSTPPWFVTTGEYHDPDVLTSNTPFFYYIEVQP